MHFQIKADDELSGKSPYRRGCSIQFTYGDPATPQASLHGRGRQRCCSDPSIPRMVAKRWQAAPVMLHFSGGAFNRVSGCMHGIYTYRKESLSTLGTDYMCRDEKAQDEYSLEELLFFVLWLRPDPIRQENWSLLPITFCSFLQLSL